MIQEHKDQWLAELFEFLRIPTISADPAYAGDVRRGAEWVKAALEKRGVSAQMFETPGHPIVYGEIQAGSGKPTVLVYGHYDVQPPDPLDLWQSKPFEPEIRDGNIFGRGSCDDKGQLFMNIAALDVLRGQGELPCNIKFCIEGEEESGSIHLDDFIESHKELLACDTVLVSDTSMIANDIPSITVGLRGLAYLEVMVTGPNRDLHSGVYGGTVENPLIVLSTMLASVKDSEGRVTIPGFYDKVQVVGEAERVALQSVPFDEAAYKADLGVAALKPEAGYSPFEATRIRPSFDINGIWGGYMGEGAKTILPSVAHAKISFRLVPNQRSADIAELVMAHLKKIAPPSVMVSVKNLHGGEGGAISLDSPYYRAAARAMRETCGKEPVPDRCGGSIPVVASFQKFLGRDTILLGFGLDSDAIHSPNEKFGVWNFLKGIETIPLFYRYVVEG